MTTAQESAALIVTMREMVAAGRTGYQLDLLLSKKQPALVPPKLVLDLLSVLEIAADRLTIALADLARVAEERDNAIVEGTADADTIEGIRHIVGLDGNTKVSLVYAVEKIREVLADEIAAREVAESAGTFEQGRDAAAKYMDEGGDVAWRNAQHANQEERVRLLSVASWYRSAAICIRALQPPTVSTRDAPDAPQR